MNDRSAPLVAHVIHKLDVGGLENGIVNIVNRMPQERFRHAVICLSGYSPMFRSRIHRDDVEVVSLDKCPGKDLAVYWRLWRMLRRLQPAIVHTRNLGTVDMQWVAWAAGVDRRVHGEHGWEASDPEGQNRRHLMIRRACRPVIQRYVPMSIDLARWLERDVKVNPCAIRQLYNGVDTVRFCPPTEGAARREGTVTIGTVGRLDPVKNQSELLQVLKALVESEPTLRSKLRLLIVGDGALRKPLEKLADELGVAAQVEFAGASDDTPGMLQRMDVFVLPSMNEGISNTILEAMATGLPVVAGCVGGNPELVQHAITGHLYEPRVSGALQRALHAYVVDPDLRCAHGSAGRQRVVQNFKLDTMVERYLELYEELLGNKPYPIPSPAHAGEGGRNLGEGS